MILGDANVLDKAFRMEVEGRHGALVIVTETKGSSAGKVGMKMVIAEDGQSFGTVGGGAIESKVFELARDVMRQGSPVSVSFDLTKDLGMSCGGWMALYIEPIGVRPRVVVFGAGHIGFALSRIVQTAGFAVTVVDDREELANPQRLGEDCRIESISPEDGHERLGIDSESYLVFATRSHELDLQWLLTVGDRKVKYRGVIGSARKIKLLKERLLHAGWDEDAVRTLRAPIGINIGALSPGEIAVSIVAEMIAVRYGVDDTRALYRL